MFSTNAWRAGIVLVAAGLLLSVSQEPAGSAPPPHANSAAFGPVHPNLSPSGTRVVFSYQGSIWWMPVEGKKMTRLTSGPGLDVYPVWSPDETRIAFVRSDNFQQGTVRMIGMDGSEITLPGQTRVNGKLYFDEDGRRLLMNVIEGGPAMLSWFDTQGGSLTRLAEMKGYRSPYALSHDGASIALVSHQDLEGEQGGNNGPSADLWKMPAQGGEPVKIMRFPARIFDLCWRADDRALLAVTDRGGAHYDIWEIPLEDPEAGARRLTFDHADEDAPSVSGDGRFLLYTNNHDGATGLILRELGQGHNAERWISVQSLDFAAPTGTLSLSLRDRESGRALDARVSIRQLEGKFHAPFGALYRVLRGNLYFYAHQAAQLELPAGSYRVQVNRGPEYKTLTQTVEVEAGRRSNLELEPERWIHQRAHGWYSGESHIHANYGYGHWYNSPVIMRLQGSGEDLVVCNFMVAQSDGDGVFDREFFRGRPDPLSSDQTLLYWNEEFRSTIWGHMTILNLKRLIEPIFTGFAETTNPFDYPTNADIADHVHDQDGHVNYTHPATNLKDPYLSAYSAKGLPVDAALGKVDSIDVMGSNYEANLPLWYGLLNCGLRIAASAGTDSFLNRISGQVPGADRVYVQVPGTLTYQSWIANLKAGRSFVTNAPMLSLQVKGTGLGGTVRVSRAETVKVAGRVISNHPLDRVELVYNGEVVAHGRLSADGRQAMLEEQLPLGRSGWMALRAAGPDQPDMPKAFVFGHTGPIYIEVEGRPIEAVESARYFLGWIDRLEEDLKRRDRIPSRFREHVHGLLNSARAFYSKLLR